MNDLARVVGWLDALLADRTSVHVPTAVGTAMLCPRFPAAHDHNLLVLAPDADAAGALAAAEAVLGAAGLAHRALDATHADADALAPLLADAGYARADELVMVHPGPVAAAADAVTIVELDAGERARTAAAAWQVEFPGWDPEVCRQLGARVATLPEDLDACFLAIRDLDGSVVARADLYVRHGVAQVEELITDPGARRRGHGSALVREAVCRAQEAGAELTFLLADADEAPAALYRRLGFADRGRRAGFTRP